MAISPTMQGALTPRQRQEVEAVEKRLGKTTGVSKGKKALPKPKVKPSLKKNKAGFKVAWRL